MGALIGLYVNDSRVVIGRSVVAYPVSVNTGFALVGTAITGFAPITTQVQTGWTNIYSGATRSISGYNNRFGNTVNYNRGWRPSYATITGYAAVYSPVYYGGTMATGFRSSMI